jgi:hypothetical protein
MKRSDIKKMPQYFDKYINQVDDIELDAAFQNNLNTIGGLDIPALESLKDKTYAAGKWTIKDIFRHIIDTERVFAYRTLRFARRDGIIPQGYDQDVFAANANAQQSPLKDIIEEMKLIHQSSSLLFRSFDKETLQVTGICWNQETSVLTMGFILTGHFIHHWKIIKEKYLPLVYETA